MTSTELSPTARVDRLELPSDESVGLVLNTDAHNEVDDRFAIVHALRSPHGVEALYAAPFHNQRSDGPEDGMERSYEESERVLDRVRESRRVYRGAKRYIDATEDPVESPAAEIPDRACTRGPGRPAVRRRHRRGDERRLRHRVGPLHRRGGRGRLAGGARHTTGTPPRSSTSRRTSLRRVPFDSGVPLVHVPTVNVAEHVRTTLPELRELLLEPDAGDGVGPFLYGRVADYQGADDRAWSKVIWDLAATVVLATPETVETVRVPSPILTSEETWNRERATRHPGRATRRQGGDLRGPGRATRRLTGRRPTEASPGTRPGDRSLDLSENPQEAGSPPVRRV